jgi:hypothetical protein
MNGTDAKTVGTPDNAASSSISPVLVDTTSVFELLAKVDSECRSIETAFDNYDEIMQKRHDDYEQCCLDISGYLTEAELLEIEVMNEIYLQDAQQFQDPLYDAFDAIREHNKILKSIVDVFISNTGLSEFINPLSK